MGGYQNNFSEWEDSEKSTYGMIYIVYIYIKWKLF